MPTLYIVGIVIAVIIFLCIFVTVCYKKAPPTEAIVITGLGHREPKVVCGRGAFVIPFVQRADTLDMRIMKMDVKTPETGVKTSEGVPLWIDSVVTAQVYSDNSSISEEEMLELGVESKIDYITARQQMAIFVREACYTLRQQVSSGIIYVQRFSVFCLLNYVKNRIDEKN